jgi:hypothetical protein
MTIKLNADTVIEDTDAAAIPLTVKGAAAQTARLLSIIDSADAVLAEITDTGHFDNKDGIRTVTPEYGAGFGIQMFGEDAPEHFNQLGWYDHAGGAFPNLLNKTSGDDFTQADADNANWIIFISGTNFGAMAEIKEFINATSVVVSGFGWDQDINTSGDPGNFITVKHPSFVTGFGFKHEFSCGSAGEFEVVGYGHTGPFVSIFEHDAGADNADGTLFKAEAGGFNNVNTVVVDYRAGDLQPGDNGGAMGVLVDVSQAASADATTTVTNVIYVVINGSDATTNAMSVLPGFTNALVVAGSSEEDPAQGYDWDGATLTNRVTGTPQDGTAFLDTSTTDITIFDDDDDYILMGSAAPFEVVSATLVTGSSKNLVPTFEYSTAGDTWTALPSVSDSTNGFQNSGLISFTAPGDWATMTASGDGAVNSAYYVRIRRTYAPVIATSPVEDHFKTFASKTAGMSIRGDGVVQLPYLGAAPANLENGMIWTEADGLHMYVGGAEVTVP